MIRYLSVRTHVLRLGMALGCFVLALSVFSVSTASAAVGVCRSDPVFTLSSGKTITLNESVTDTKTDITGGSYVLHIPTGRKITSISYSGAVGSSQSMTWTADQKAGVFTATSDVLTKTAKIPVTASMTVGSNNSSTTTGLSNTALPNSVSSPNS